MRNAHPSIALRLLPAYLGTDSVAEAIRTVRGQRMLWLEILVNDQIDLSPWKSEPAVQAAYRTACRWYTQYRRFITFLIDRTPLPADTDPIDARDYRAFAEALFFLYAHRPHTRVVKRWAVLRLLFPETS